MNGPMGVVVEVAQVRRGANVNTPSDNTMASPPPPHT